jgi:hypothetical protein
VQCRARTVRPTRHLLGIPILLIGTALCVFNTGRAQNTPEKARLSGAAKMPATSRPHDLTGIWDTQNPRGFQPNTALFPGEIPPLTPWAQAQLAAARPSYGPHAVPDSTDPVNPTKLGAHGCFPPGVPRIYLHPVPMEIIRIPGRVFMRFEFDHLLREIWTDGRGHPSDWNPTYMGHSIGKWEGGAFVVDTIGFNDKTWIDRVGHRHSEDLHVIERFRRVDHDTLRDDITMEDPKAFTKPWTTYVIFALRPDWEILEHACADNADFDQNLQMQGQGK